MTGAAGRSAHAAPMARSFPRWLEPVPSATAMGRWYGPVPVTPVPKGRRTLPINRHRCRGLGTATMPRHFKRRPRVNNRLMDNIVEFPWVPLRPFGGTTWATPPWCVCVLAHDRLSCAKGECILRAADGPMAFQVCILQISGREPCDAALQRSDERTVEATYDNDPVTSLRLNRSWWSVARLCLPLRRW